MDNQDAPTAKDVLLSDSSVHLNNIRVQSVD